MPRISLLPDFLRNQIAAGEVVERPASVVKELVENSLDAGAQRITIEVADKDSGFLRITDDGCGMDKEDAVMAFERHATSKIRTAEDLWQIKTMGFRGEAIASIASVARVRLHTKVEGSIEGTCVEVEGGKLVKNEAIGCPEGTQIEVSDLFYNVPARKKYLKQLSTEYSHILETITLLALGFPAVGFRFIYNQKIIFDLPASPDRLFRVETLLGKDFASELVPVFCQHAHLQLEGFIGKPTFARSSRKHQYLLVNQRGVVAPFMSYAVKQSYHSLLPKEKYPAYIFWLTVNPDSVDVNVHPRKLEVRFHDEKELFQLILKACQQALDKHVLAPQFSFDKFGKAEMTVNTSPQTSNKWKVEDKLYTSTDITPKPYPSPTVKEKTPSPLPFGENLFDSSASSSFPQRSSEPSTLFELKEELTTLIPLTQMDNSYLLCEQQTAQGKNLVIVDQHAAHERIRYTEIMQDFERRTIPTQALLVPLQLELSRQEVNIFHENQALLKQMGFELESFGGNTFTLYSLPAVLADQDLRAVILGLLDDLANNAVKGDLQTRKEKALIYAACRSAVKFGDPLSPEEQKELCRKLMALDLPYTCPHGRPTMITLSFDELKKRFKRK